MKTLIIYYSFGGNTKRVAEYTAKSLSADIAEIRTKKQYPSDYNEVVDEGQREIQNGYKPEILPLDKDVREYDMFIIGTPVWWYTFAPAMKTFLEQTDFTGKRVYTFATNGGWLGHTQKDFNNALKGSMCGNTLDVRFDGNKLRTSEQTIKNWINTIH